MLKILCTYHCRLNSSRLIREVCGACATILRNWTFTIEWSIWQGSQLRMETMMRMRLDYVLGNILPGRHSRFHLLGLNSRFTRKAMWAVWFLFVIGHLHRFVSENLVPNKYALE